MTSHDLYELFATVMTEHGWEMAPAFNGQLGTGGVIGAIATATRTFKAVNVLKTATIIIHHSDEYHTAALNGRYMSEGQNVLSACSAYNLIPKRDNADADAKAVATAIAHFADDALKAINNSYGVRIARLLSQS